jgi:hypothetical protein
MGPRPGCHAAALSSFVGTLRMDRRDHRVCLGREQPLRARKRSRQTGQEREECGARSRRFDNKSPVEEAGTLERSPHAFKTASACSIRIRTRARNDRIFTLRTVVFY